MFQVDCNNERYKLYSVLIRPFIDVYFVSASNLHHFISQLIPERDYVKTVVTDLTKQLERGNLQCGKYLLLYVGVNHLSILINCKVNM